MRKKCPYSEIFRSVFSRIRTEYGKKLRNSPYSLWMRKNTDQKISEYGNFSRSATLRKMPEYLGKLCVFSNFQTKKLGEITVFYAVMWFTFSNFFQSFLMNLDKKLPEVDLGLLQHRRRRTLTIALILTIIKKTSILNVAAVLYPPLTSQGWLIFLQNLQLTHTSWT